MDWDTWDMDGQVRRWVIPVGTSLPRGSGSLFFLRMVTQHKVRYYLLRSSIHGLVLFLFWISSNTFFAYFPPSWSTLWRCGRGRFDSVGAFLCKPTVLAVISSPRSRTYSSRTGTASSHQEHDPGVRDGLCIRRTCCRSLPRCSQCSLSGCPPVASAPDPRQR